MPKHRKRPVQNKPKPSPDDVEVSQTTRKTETRAEKMSNRSPITASFGYRRNARRLARQGQKKSAKDQWRVALGAYLSESEPSYRRPTKRNTSKVRHIIRVYAKGWIDLFDDRREAGAYLRQAERWAVSTNNWIDCAEAWNSLLGHQRHARRCLQQARRIAAKTHDVGEQQRCETAWARILNDAKRTKRRKPKD